MKRKTKDKPAPAGARRRLWRGRGRLVLAPTALLGLAAAAAAGLHYMRQRLLASSPYADTPARVRLVGVPSWLPADIPRRVVAGIQRAADGRSVFEDDLARRVHQAAAASAWIAHVRRVTKRRDGQVLVDARFRRPFVLVQRPPTANRPFVVVDEDAVVLPLALRLLKSDSFVIIGGVAGQPPEPGRKWDAPDLADGLRLMELIRAKPYVSEITLIDVRNHNGRISPPPEPHIRMVAQLGQGPRTDIRFGHFPVDELDYCVSPRQKLAYLDAVFKANGGRLAGVNSRIELRYDRPYAASQ